MDDENLRDEIKKTVKSRYDQLAFRYNQNYVYPRSLLGWEKLRRAYQLQVQLKKYQPTMVLDIGCGSGYVTSQCSFLLPFSKITGVDFSPEMINVAQKNFHGKADFVLADIESLPFSAAKFDFIYALGVLEKFNSIEKVIAEVSRVLTKDGKFVFTYTNINSASVYMREIGYKIRYKKQLNLRKKLLNQQKVKETINKSNLRVVEKTHITFGGGIYNFPWTKSFNFLLEAFFGNRSVSSRLAMTTVWTVKKVIDEFCF